MPTKITREEFEKTYNGGDIIPLLKRGRVILPCRCNWEGCEGWAMRPVDDIELDIKVGFNTQEELDEAIAHRDELVRKEEERVQSNKGKPKI